MARPLRIEFPNAIYHVMSRGNGRQDIVRDDADRQRLVDALEQAVQRYGWELFGFVLLTNHLHAFLRTPHANVSRGMQFWLSGYANWWCKRHRHAGHVFQGRFRGELIEDESYFWAVSRYLHLNPVRARLVEHPAQWPWSSYAGYAHRRYQLPWVCYDEVWRAWRAEHGGSDARRAYRRYVEQGIVAPPVSPFASALQGWILGSAEFAGRLRRLLADQAVQLDVPRLQKLRCLDAAAVLQVVSEHYAVDEAALRARNQHTEIRSVAAWLTKRYTQVPLRELVAPLGVGRPQSVANLVRHADLALAKSARLRRNVEQIEQRLKAQQTDSTPAAPRSRKWKK